MGDGKPKGTESEPPDQLGKQPEGTCRNDKTTSNSANKAEEAIASLPKFTDLTKEDITKILEDLGFEKVKDVNGCVTWIKQFDDGTSAGVRIDKGNPGSPKDFADYNDHCHKETFPSDAFKKEKGKYPKRKTKTYNDSGKAVQSEPSEENHIVLDKYKKNESL